MQVRGRTVAYHRAGDGPLLLHGGWSDGREWAPQLEALSDEFVAVPTLVLHGDADVRAPRPVADALQAAIPGARLVVLPGVGHVVNLEAPEAFDVGRFLRTS